MTDPCMGVVTDHLEHSPLIPRPLSGHGRWPGESFTCWQVSGPWDRDRCSDQGGAIGEEGVDRERPTKMVNCWPDPQWSHTGLFDVEQWNRMCGIWTGLIIMYEFPSSANQKDQTKGKWKWKTSRSIVWGQLRILHIDRKSIQIQPCVQYDMIL